MTEDERVAAVFRVAKAAARAAQAQYRLRKPPRGMVWEPHMEWVDGAVRVPHWVAVPADE